MTNLREKGSGEADVVQPLSVYVPAALLGPLTGVAPGSGIVGPRPCETGDCPKPFVVYYEGDVYKTGEMKTLADRAINAAGRLRARYPTVACAAVRPCDVVEVGVLYEALERAAQGAPGRRAARIELARDAVGDDGRAKRLFAAWLGVGEDDVERELRSAKGPGKDSRKATRKVSAG